MHLPILIATAAVPATAAWTPTTGIIMALCNVLAIAFAKKTLPQPYEGPEMPMPHFFGGFHLPQVLGAWSLGHVVGIGVILGLANLGFI
jgi:photosystem I subunit 10